MPAALLAAACLALPAAAAGKSPDPLAGARIASMKGSVQVVATRCPPGVERTSPRCGRSRLELRFTATQGPRSRRLASGAIRVTGSGVSECTSESPAPDPVSQPDGSAQLLGPASHVRIGRFTHSDLALTATRRTIRWTWLEPTDPSVACNYFFGAGTTEYPVPAHSDRFRRAVVEKGRFTVAAGEGVQDFEQTAPDGTTIVGDASWRLTLVYKRPR